jgi:Cdc6-like AAA superfamily ATPase
MDLELNRKMYEIFFPGKNREDSVQKDVIVITGGKGLGKTTLAKYIAKLYKKYNKYDRVILLTGITNVKFPSYVKIINLNKIIPDENLDIIYCIWGRFQSTLQVPVNSPAASSRCSSTRILPRTALMCPQAPGCGVVSPAAASSAPDSWMGS